MSTDTQYVAFIDEKIKDGKTKTQDFLVAPHRACHEAWIIGRAGRDSNGPLCVRLVDQFGTALSDTAELHNQTRGERVKLLDVNIPASTFPPVVRIEAKNKASDGGSARLEGVLLVYN